MGTYILIFNFTENVYYIFERFKRDDKVMFKLTEKYVKNVQVKCQPLEVEFLNSYESKVIASSPDIEEIKGHMLLDIFEREKNVYT